MLFKMVQILPMTKAPFTNDSEVNYLFDGALIVSEDSHVFFLFVWSLNDIFSNFERLMVALFWDCINQRLSSYCRTCSCSPTLVTELCLKAIMTSPPA